MPVLSNSLTRFNPFFLVHGAYCGMLKAQNKQGVNGCFFLDVIERAMLLDERMHLMRLHFLGRIFGRDICVNYNELYIRDGWETKGTWH